MVRKFFPLDKNYVLEEVQLRLKDRLLSDLVEKAKKSHQQVHNPLGLNDAFSEVLMSYRPDDLKILDSFYENLCGIYRYKYGETQLGFLWDGRGHEDKYEEDFVSTFNKWADKLCDRSDFVQAVLNLTVFLSRHSHPQLAESRMKTLIFDLFDLKIHKVKGIVEMKVA